MTVFRITGAFHVYSFPFVFVLGGLLLYLAVWFKVGHFGFLGDIFSIFLVMIYGVFVMFC